MEARHRFDLSNAVSVPLGVFNFLAPLFALQFSKTLFAVIVALSITRIIALIARRDFGVPRRFKRARNDIQLGRYGPSRQVWRMGNGFANNRSVDRLFRQVRDSYACLAQSALCLRAAGPSRLDF